jgi:hypothetical protein
MDFIPFEVCWQVLSEVLKNNMKGVDESPNCCGVVYSDFRLPEIKREHESIVLSYRGKKSTGILQVHLLAVHPPVNWRRSAQLRLPLLSEAIANMLSFSLRTRFGASRRLGYITEDGGIIVPDLFVRLTSPSAGPFARNSYSSNWIKRGIDIFNESLDILRDIDAVTFEAIGRSLHMYALAHLTEEIDLGLAYVPLVSSVESLIKRKENESDTAAFVRFMQDNLPDSFFKEPDSRAWEEDRWLEETTPWNISIIDSCRRRFEDGASAERSLASLKHILNDVVFERLKKAFEKGEDIPKEEKELYDQLLRHRYVYGVHERLEQTELSKALKDIYRRARSKFLHYGGSPPESVGGRYETAPLSPKIADNGSLSWRRDIPSFYLFERMVHTVILTYLKTLL